MIKLIQIKSRKRAIRGMEDEIYTLLQSISDYTEPLSKKVIREYLYANLFKIAPSTYTVMKIRDYVYIQDVDGNIIYLIGLISTLRWSCIDKLAICATHGIKTYMVYDGNSHSYDTIAKDMGVRYRRFPMIYDSLNKLTVLITSDNKDASPRVSDKRLHENLGKIHDYVDNGILPDLSRK